ncbi:MAG: phosphoenolpyruvate-utilizing N-terminal domain-containing protein, partial [bacterium]
MKETSNGYTIVKRFQGKGLSPGISFGTAHRVESEVPAFYRVSIRPKDVDTELERLSQALEKSMEQYSLDKGKLEKALGKEHSYIFEAHLQMLKDPHFLSEIEKRIEGLESPEKALRCVSEELLAAYHSLNDAFFRDRSFDFEEVVDRILSNLVEIPHREDPDLPDDLILVAPKIGMSTLVKYPLDRVKGLVLSEAGQTSHVAIVARSHQIPVVSGIRRVRDTIRTGQTLVVDGSEGVVEIVVSPEEFEQVRNRVDRAKKKLPEV